MHAFVGDNGTGPSLTLASLAAIVVASVAALLVALSSPPAPDTPLPQTPVGFARTLVAADASLRDAIDGWAPRTATVPPTLTLYALYEQRLYRALSANPPLSRAVLPQLAGRLATHARDIVTAHRELVRITPPLRTRFPRIGRAAPPDDLLRWYRDAQRRFAVPWNVLAAVNFVESAFGKLRSPSAAGAQGPMQFMPDTWRAYGLGGDVHDPHDAILGAANYLRASGARTSVKRALHAYNPSSFYVDAVLRYAREIAADPHVFYELYAWQVYVRTPSGSVRLTGPGRH